MVLTEGVHGPTLGPVESLIINALLIGICFYLLCRPVNSPRREILVLSSITLVAAASRVALEPLPNVQPMTMMCLVLGAALGSRRGMAFAIIATLLSNLVLSNGWWTLFQASGWAAVAFAGSRLPILNQNQINMKVLISACICTSIMFDWWVSLSIYESGMSLSTFGVYLLNGIPFDIMHAIASVTAAVLFAPWLNNLIHEEVAQDVVSNPVGDADVVRN